MILLSLQMRRVSRAEPLDAPTLLAQGSEQPARPSDNQAMCRDAIGIGRDRACTFSQCPADQRRHPMPLQPALALHMNIELTTHFDCAAGKSTGNSLHFNLACRQDLPKTDCPTVATTSHVQLVAARGNIAKPICLHLDNAAVQILQPLLC